MRYDKSERLVWNLCSATNLKDWPGNSDVWQMIWNPWSATNLKDWPGKSDGLKDWNVWYENPWSATNLKDWPGKSDVCKKTERVKCFLTWNPWSATNLEDWPEKSGSVANLRTGLKKVKIVKSGGLTWNPWIATYPKGWPGNSDVTQIKWTCLETANWGLLFPIFSYHFPDGAREAGVWSSATYTTY